MRTTRNIVLFVLAAVIAAPGWAQDDDHDDHGDHDRHHYAKKTCGAEASVCVRGMVDKLSQKGWIGIEWNDENEIPVLTQVVGGSPAEAAGLRKGDKLLAFNGVSTSAGEEAVWAEVKKSMLPGRTITLTIERAGAEKDVDVLLAALPRHVMAQWIGNHMIDHHLAENDKEGDIAEAATPEPSC
ncbi:MAG: PDZ domain-containing protein [Acidobacteria bacterium]|nr:PDZ domain-containing protein [Acidobacteriota bacterium]